MSQTNFDYIVIGGGSAGCVVAARLAESGQGSVLLLEAGPRHDDPEFADIISTPGRFSELWSTEAAFQYFTEPEPELRERGRRSHKRVFWPRGHVLGGGGSINSMVHVRGNRQDYDTWAYLGNDGWSFEELQPHFERSAASGLATEKIRGAHPASPAFVEACVARGYARNDDFNGAGQYGAGLLDVYIRDGRRVSSATAFLSTARANLTVRSRAYARRLLLRNGTAFGVEYSQGGAERRQVRQVLAAREVVVCGGAVESPKLLMLSGIGPRRELERLGIPVRMDLPGVGENLQDHAIASVGFHYAGGQTSPPAAAGAVEAALFWREDGLAGPPEIQFHFTHVMLVDPQFLASPQDLPRGFAIVPTLLRPRSRGRISLRSANPDEHPVIEANYLAVRRDLELLMGGVKEARRIAATAPLSHFRGDEAAPGAGVQTDSDLETYVREAAGGLFHGSCSCRMGWDPLAVVDPQLRVHGVGRLRVADASVMPLITSGNTNAPSVMIGEKCAAMLTGEKYAKVQAA